jgi:hypothetical protein
MTALLELAKNRKARTQMVTDLLEKMKEDFKYKVYCKWSDHYPVYARLQRWMKDEAGVQPVEVA